MSISIVYLQANDQVAKKVKENFDEEQIEFLIVSSAKEAFGLFEQREISLTLVDANIPDMKFQECIDKITREYPQMLLCVCTDISDTKKIYKLANTLNVKKVFLPPWNIEDIVDGVCATIDYMRVKDDYEARKRELKKEEDAFNATLERLKNSLLRQQYSYNKIAPFFIKTIEAFLEESSLEDDTKPLIIKACNKMLRLQTAVALKSENLQETVAKDFAEIKNEYPGINVESIEISIIGDVEKSILGNVVFMLWLLGYYEASKTNEAKITITSRYVTSSKCEISISINGANPCEDEISNYVTMLLEKIVDEFDVTEEDNIKKYDLRIRI